LLFFVAGERNGAERLKPVTHREQVIEESTRIATLARLIAEAADAQFGADIDEERFENGLGSDYSQAIRAFRIQMERSVHLAEGLDRTLDEKIMLYVARVLRAHPDHIRPALFRGIVN
jgi:hypothetical protein